MKTTFVRSLSGLIGHRIAVLDDDSLGKAQDFLFDDQHWTIRYLVADTGDWLSEHQVIVSPFQFRNADLRDIEDAFPVMLTKRQIGECPPLEKGVPVSRQYEMAYAKYHRHPPYWIGGGIWGAGSYPMAPNAHLSSVAESDTETEQIEQCHLRSAGEIFGYRIDTTDGELGHVEDLIVETKTWTISWMVVDTRNSLPGRSVLIGPKWLREFNGKTKKAKVDLTRDQIKGSSKFDPKQPLDRSDSGDSYDSLESRQLECHGAANACCTSNWDGKSILQI